MADTILVVDDDPISLKICTRLLEKNGFHTVSAGSGKTAMMLYQNEHPALILMDMEMPEMSGSETMQVIRGFEEENTLRCVPAFFFSGNDPAEALEDVRVCKMDGLLKKPVSPNVLIDTVNKTLGKGE